MGSSSSTNIMNETLEAVTNITTNIMQTSDVSGYTTQFIGINGDVIDSDVTISGTSQISELNVDTSALFSATVDEDVQQDMSQTLTQLASSTTSGINLGNFSKAYNSGTMLCSATMNLTTDMSTSCSANAQTSQFVGVNGNVEGSTVTITDIDQQSVTNLVSSCIGSSLASITAVQDLQQDADQTAKATTKGFSIWGLVALLLVALLMMIMPLEFMVKDVITMVMYFIWPMIMITGAIFCLLYFTGTQKDMTMISFSKGFSNSADGAACVGGGEKSSKVYTSYIDAANACKSNSNYKAFDWLLYDVNEDGTITMKDTPETTFYTSYKSSCSVEKIQDSNFNLFTTPNYYWGYDAPENSGKTLGTDFYTAPIQTNYNESSTDSFDKMDVGDMYLQCNISGNWDNNGTVNWNVLAWRKEFQSTSGSSIATHWVQMEYSQVNPSWCPSSTNAFSPSCNDISPAPADNGWGESSTDSTSYSKPIFAFYSSPQTDNSFVSKTSETGLGLTYQSTDNNGPKISDTTPCVCIDISYTGTVETTIGHIDTDNTFTYDKDNTNDVESTQYKGPGMKVYTQKDTYGNFAYNTSGYKTTTKKTYYLWFGIALIIFGAVATMMLVFKKTKLGKEPSKSKTKKVEIDVDTSKAEPKVESKFLF